MFRWDVSVGTFPSIASTPGEPPADSDSTTSLSDSARVAAFLRSEAVEQSIAAGGAQVVLAAGARHVSRVPGPRVDVVLQSRAVGVAERRAAEGVAARPIVAGQVDVRRPRPAI